MPVQGALIRASDYTDVRKAISRILGDRIGEFLSDSERAKYGYGQGVLSDAQEVTPEINFVDDLNMATLRSDVLKIAGHCGILTNPLILALPTILPGDLIDNNHLDAFIAAIPILNANRFLLGPGQFSDTTFTIDISNTRTTPWGASYYYGQNTVRHSFTIDFTTSERARYFFNSGGQIRFSASRTGGTPGSPQNQNWTELLQDMGTIVFNYNSCQGAAGTGSNIGFYELTNNPQQVFTKTGGFAGYYGSYYTSNDYTITMSCNVANNNLGEARYVYVNIYFNDDHTAKFQINDTVDGVLTSSVNVRRATGSNVQVPVPSATNTVLLTS